MKAYPAHNRAVNRGRILEHVLREGPLARVDLAQRTALTPAAVSNITRELIDDELLQEAGESRQGHVGANAILLDIPTRRYTVGAVHQGVSALRVGICDLRGRLIARQQILTPQRSSPEWTAAAIATTFADLYRATLYHPRDQIGVGFGAVGLVDDKAGVVKHSPSIGWEQVPIRRMLEERLQVPVVVENNIRAMAIAESMIGAARDQTSFAFVYIGTGIGAGLIVDHRPFRGAYGGAGEIGHITVNPRGARCACGNRGCLETIAAEPAILARASAEGLDLGAPGSHIKDLVLQLTQMSLQGDGRAERVVAETGESLGIALATLVDLLNPGSIVLHGAITQAGDSFFAAVARTLHQRAFLAENEEVVLREATFGEQAGLIGAAMVAVNHLLLAAGAIPQPNSTPAHTATI